MKRRTSAPEATLCTGHLLHIRIRHAKKGILTRITTRSATLVAHHEGLLKSTLSPLLPLLHSRKRRKLQDIFQFLLQNCQRGAAL